MGISRCSFLPLPLLYAELSCSCDRLEGTSDIGPREGPSLYSRSARATNAGHLVCLVSRVSPEAHCPSSSSRRRAPPRWNSP